MLDSDEMLELQEMQYVYIRGMFRYLVTQFVNSVQSVYESSNATRVTLLILGIILIILFYLVVWVPTLNNIAKEVQRVRSMMLMIPLDICAEVASIRTML